MVIQMLALKEEGHEVKEMERACNKRTGKRVIIKSGERERRERVIIK